MFNGLFIFQLPNVKTQLDKMNEVMKTDLSAIVQRVSTDRKSRDRHIRFYMSGFFFYFGVAFLLFSIHRDIPL